MVTVLVVEEAGVPGENPFEQLKTVHWFILKLQQKTGAHASTFNYFFYIDFVINVEFIIHFISSLSQLRYKFLQS
jgi:hypothetical protein